MLILSRKLGQRFLIGEDVSITIVKIDRHSVRIGIEAPGEVGILREELSGAPDVLPLPTRTRRTNAA